VGRVVSCKVGNRQNNHRHSASSLVPARPFEEWGSTAEVGMGRIHRVGNEVVGSCRYSVHFGEDMAAGDVADVGDAGESTVVHTCRKDRTGRIDNCKDRWPDLSQIGLGPMVPREDVVRDWRTVWEAETMSYVAEGILRRDPELGHCH
jgi:hypothetical protein